MKKQQDLTLMKARSYRSILADGYRLYNENFRKLFKASWFMTLIYAIVGAALGMLGTIHLPNLTALVMALVVLIVLTVITESLTVATVINKLKEHQDANAITPPVSWLKLNSKMMGRTLKATIFSLPVCIILLPLFPLILPINYVNIKYILTPEQSFWPSLWGNYKRGLRYWGSIFLVFFVSLLLVALISIIVMTPAFILSIANVQAHQGLLMGDALGMPSYILPLTFGTLMLTHFIEFYVVLIVLVHFYYIYGSIEAKETEREQTLSKL